MELRIFNYLFLLLAILLLSAGMADGQLADSPWPMFHGDVRHTGLSPYDTSHVDGTIKWTFEAGGAIESSPTIASDGTIYIGSHDGKLYAINLDGKQKWQFDTGKIEYIEKWNNSKSIMASPAIASDGTVYIHSAADYLFAINSDGKEKWRFPLEWHSDFWTSPTIGRDGTIYIGSARTDDSNSMGLFAINPNGKEKWRFIITSGVSSVPAIADDGTIYVGGADPVTNKGRVYAVNPDGTKKWEFKTEDWQESSPSIGKDGTIYIGSKEGKVYAINPDGGKKWDFQTGDGVSASPAIGKDGTIYVGSWDYYFYALNPDGTLKWKLLTDAAYEGVSSSAAIGSDGTIYFGSNNGKFYAVNPDGTQKWVYDTTSSIPSSPAIASDGTVYIGSWNNKLYAFGGAAKKETSFSQGENETIPSEEIGYPLENTTKDTEITGEAPSTKNMQVIYAIVAVAIAIVIGIIALKKRKK